MAQRGAAFGIVFLDKQKYGTKLDAIKNNPARKYIILHKGYYSHPLYSVTVVSEKERVLRAPLSAVKEDRRNT